MTAAWLLITLALPQRPSGERSYRIRVDGQESGAASLSIRALPDGSFDYRWRSQIGVSRTPCLWSEEQRSGNYIQGSGHTLPDELALSLLPTDSTGNLTATVNGQRAHAVIGRDGLPDRVDLLDLGLSYLATPAGTLRWDRCGQGALERGPAFTGAESLTDPRRVVRATFQRIDIPGGWQVDVRVPEGPLPPSAQRLVVREYRQAPGRDCKVVAEELAQALERGGFHARVAAGWIVDKGALWPHAWTEIQLDGAFRALDATTSPGWADAARIKLGGLDGPSAAATGQRLLSERHARIRLVDVAAAR